MKGGFANEKGGGIRYQASSGFEPSHRKICRDEDDGKRNILWWSENFMTWAFWMPRTWSTMW